MGEPGIGKLTTGELLERLRALDVRVWAEDGKLRVNAPSGALSAELRSALQERKAELRLIPLLLELLARGRADRVFLSQDVCHNEQLRYYGGNGYTYLQETFLPRLRAAGVGEAEIRQMTVENPRRLLTIG